MGPHKHQRLTSLLRRGRDGTTEVQVCACRATRVVVTGLDGIEHAEPWSMAPDRLRVQHEQEAVHVARKTLH